MPVPRLLHCRGQLGRRHRDSSAGCTSSPRRSNRSWVGGRIIRRRRRRPDQIWIASLAFCILGSLLYFPDLWGFCMRVDPNDAPRFAKESATITATVFFLEDLPQLVLNAGIYLPTLGFGNADPVAILRHLIFALVMSGLSLFLNVGLFANECGCWQRVKDKFAAPTIPAHHARPPSNFGFGEASSI